MVVTFHNRQLASIKCLLNISQNVRPIRFLEAALSRGQRGHNGKIRGAVICHEKSAAAWHSRKTTEMFLVILTHLC